MLLGALTVYVMVLLVICPSLEVAVTVNVWRPTVVVSIA
jgi:hypothetical protein